MKWKEYQMDPILEKHCNQQAVRYPNSQIATANSKMRKVHDRLHLRNHQEECRKGDLNPDKYEILNGVNTQVAEQFFSHLLKFVVTFRNTNSIRAPIWISLILHQWNVRKEVKLTNSIPTKKHMENVPICNRVKFFKTWKNNVSGKSKKRLKSLTDELRIQLIRPWTPRVSTLNNKVIGQSLKRKRK